MMTKALKKCPQSKYKCVQTVKVINQNINK